MYPFYLFLICINGNSVCFNLCEGTGCRAKEVPFFTPLTSERDDHLFWLHYGAWSSGRGASPFTEGPPLSGHTKVPPNLHQTQDGSVWREELAPRDLQDHAAGDPSLPCWFLSMLHSLLLESVCFLSLAPPVYSSAGKCYLQFISVRP